MTDPFAIAGIASEILSRTSSTARVQEIVQLSLAPVFLLAAIGAVLNVMNMRLIWIVDRVRKLEKAERTAGLQDREVEELPALRKRQRYAQYAINLSSTAALIICLVIALMFISAFVKPAIGTLVAICWVGAMALVIAALLFFMQETRIATATAKERRRISRNIEAKAGDE